MLTTRTEVVEYLVSEGKPRNLARAMTEEFLNLDAKNELGEPIRFHNIEEGGKLEESTALQFYEDFLDYDVFEDENGIWFDGELLFDKDGYYIHSKGV